MKELTARFVVAYDKADFDMIAGLMAMDKLDVAICAPALSVSRIFPRRLRALERPMRMQDHAGPWRILVMSTCHPDNFRP